MADNNQNQNTSQATPASNQNLIVGIVMGAMILLLLLFVINQQFGGFSKEDKELSKLQKEAKEALADRNSTKSALGITNGRTSAALTAKIKADVDALSALLAANESNLDRLRGSQEAVGSLSRQITDLQNQLAQARIDAQRVPSLEQQLAQFRADADSANQRLAGMAPKSTVDDLRQRLAESEARNITLTDELNRLKANAAGMVDSSQLDTLTDENLRLKAEIQRMRALLDKKLFVTRDQLSPRAQTLFSELVRLEGNSPAQRLRAYERISQDLNARVVKSTSFASGSSTLKQNVQDQIGQAALTSPGNAFFLVVGYASKTGDAKNNQALSEKRSINVASVTNSLKQAGQQVQAVYLGQTNRFGSTAAPNQVCEIWEIRP